MLRPSLAILTTVACLVAAPSAGADPRPPAVSVSYADLDLTTEAGASTLLVRLKRAARLVCDETRLSIMGLAAVERHKACITSALDHSVQSVESETLARLYWATQPGQTVTTASRQD